MFALLAVTPSVARAQGFSSAIFQTPLGGFPLPRFDFSKPPPRTRVVSPPPVTGDYVGPWEKLTLLEKARMLTVKVGMTREQLLDVFQRAGGMQAVDRERPTLHVYEYRACRYYKVRVEFALLGKPQRGADGLLRTEEGLDDVITKISPPFLAQVYDD